MQEGKSSKTTNIIIMSGRKRRSYSFVPRSSGSPSTSYNEYTNCTVELLTSSIKVELEVLSYRQTDTVISVYMVRYRYIINNQVKTG